MTTVFAGMTREGEHPELLPRMNTLWDVRAPRYPWPFFFYNECPTMVD